MDLDAVFPGLRQQYSEDRVYIESDLFDGLKQVHGDDLRSEIENIPEYFFNEKGSFMSVGGDGLRQGEKREVFLDDNLDEQDQRYYMLLLRQPRD